MTLGSDIEAALPGLRAEAESRMTEAVVVGPATDGVDPETGDPTLAIDPERYAGKARIRYGSVTASTNDGNGASIGQPLTTQSPYLSVPWGSPRLYEGDQVHVTGSASDALLVNRWYTIAGNAAIGQVTAHRYPLTETT